MQVRLTTTVETIIDIDPNNNPTFEEARREISGRLAESEEAEAYTDGIQSCQSNAVVFDNVRTQTTSHSFEEVK
jgi:hypothetical protein